MMGGINYMGCIFYHTLLQCGTGVCERTGNGKQISKLLTPQEIHSSIKISCFQVHCIEMKRSWPPVMDERRGETSCRERGGGEEEVGLGRQAEGQGDRGTRGVTFKERKRKRILFYNAKNDIRAII